MDSRAYTIEGFLVEAGIQNWNREPLPTDASARRYYRLTHGDQTRILMDAALDGSVDAFVAIDVHLRALGLAAPEIFVQAQDKGLLLLEDLGSEHAADFLRSEPSAEKDIYLATTQAILKLQSHVPPEGLAQLDASNAAELAGLYKDWFAPEVPETLFAHLETAWKELAPHKLVMSLRDLHAENIIWRPHLNGFARVGLLDFQDAVITHPVYDIVSLLRDARRDVAEDTAVAVRCSFLEATGMNAVDFDRAFAVISTQRALRILGIFTRLTGRDRKPKYAAFVPRMKAYLREDLAHPALSDIAALVLPDIDSHA